MGPFPPDPNSPLSTINTVQREINEAGNEAIAIAVDVRYEESIRSMVESVIKASQPCDIFFPLGS